MKIWKKIATYQPKKGTLFTWILNVARNTAIDKIRSQEYKQKSVTSTFEWSSNDHQASTQTPVEHIGLKGIVNKLKPELQEIIEVIYFKGYTHQEASKLLELPLGTIKTRIKIAIRELRKLTK